MCYYQYVIKLTYSLLISVPHNTDNGHDDEDKAQQAASDNQSYIKRRQCGCVLGVWIEERIRWQEIMNYMEWHN